MQPSRNKDYVDIPITFDVRTGGAGINAQGKPLWVLIVTVVWLLISVLTFLIAETHWRFTFPFVSFFVLIWIIRFVIIGEKGYRKLREELVSNEYIFPQEVFWNIYEVSSRYPYIAQFGNGKKGVFVAFAKDVTVGRPDDAVFLHHEAIAEAYKHMSKVGIEATHIDYMDTAGKDTRIPELFKQVERTENEDLRNLMFHKFDYMEMVMNTSYTSYDVYVFYWFGRDEAFLDELQEVLDLFLNANYLNYKFMSRKNIGELTKSLMNIDDFSISGATEDIFKEMNRSAYIKPIWVDKDGEREVLNKTTEELKEFERIRKAEKSVKPKDKKPLFKRKKKNQEEEDNINLFD